MEDVHPGREDKVLNGSNVMSNERQAVLSYYQMICHYYPSYKLAMEGDRLCLSNEE